MVNAGHFVEIVPEWQTVSLFAKFALNLSDSVVKVTEIKLAQSFPIMV